MARALHGKKCIVWGAKPKVAGGSHRKPEPQDQSHLTPIRMAIINKSTNNRCWLGCGEKATLMHVGRNADWCTHRGKQYGVSSKN